MSGIYIHIPFCNKRCTYCDFFLVTNKDLIGKFLQSLKIEIEINKDKYPHEKFDSVYFGGGTPSLLSPEQFSGILSILRNSFDISTDSEITLEANPEDFYDKNVEDYVKAGLNRISFGAQSFINEELKFLTRNHTAEMASGVISKTREYIENINIDIIYSLPGQSIENLNYSLEKALELGAKHISAYSLTFEPDTVLYKMLSEKKVKNNPSELESEMFSLIHRKLTNMDFDHYEISNYALKGFESKHNLKYWSYNNYLGLGPSSHSFFNNSRWNNYRSLRKYFNFLEDGILPVENAYALTNDQKKFEYIMLNLRSRGISFKKYEELFHEDFSGRYEDAVLDLVENNYAERNENNFTLTEKGFVIADEIIAKYF